MAHEQSDDVHEGEAEELGQHGQERRAQVRARWPSGSPEQYGLWPCMAFWLGASFYPLPTRCLRAAFWTVLCVWPTESLRPPHGLPLT
jgi:hypothetical protein